MSNKVVMMDFGLVYLTGNTDFNFNGSTVLVTGSYAYDNAARIYGLSPYNTRMYAHNSEWISVAVNDEGEAQGYQLGYNGRNYLVPDIRTPLCLDYPVFRPTTVQSTHGPLSTGGRLTSLTSRTTQ